MEGLVYKVEKLEGQMKQIDGRVIGLEQQRKLDQLRFKHLEEEVPAIKVSRHAEVNI